MEVATFTEIGKTKSTNSARVGVEYQKFNFRQLIVGYTSVEFKQDIKTVV